MRGALLAVISISIITANSAFADKTLPAATAPILRNPTNCAAKYYPPGAIKADETGATTVTVLVDENGKATNVTVDKSSGFADLDDATARCVSSFLFSPAMQNGAPITGTKQYRIVYHLSEEWTPTNTSGYPNLCQNSSDFPTADKTASIGTTFVFRVGEDGKVKYLFVANSSGSAAFDEAAIQCASKWIYHPAMINKQANEVPWSTEILWNPLLGLISLEGTRFNHAAVCDDSLYPPAAAQAKIEGTTNLSFTIVAHGAPTDVKVDKSSGSEALDAASVTCAQSWRYKEPKFNDPNISEPWGAQIIWKDNHVFVLQVPK
jgi:TonB family protein